MTGERAAFRLGLAVVLLSILSVALAGAAGTVSVTEATLTEHEIAAGETTTATATVENTADGERTFTVRLTVDGRATMETAVTLDAGETREISLAYLFEESGEYDIAVNGASAGTLTVIEPTGSVDEAGASVPVALITLVVVPLVAVVVSAIYLVRVRRRQ